MTTTPDPGGRAVVVGVDGSPRSREAIKLAAEEAAYRSAPLIAVQAYNGERPFAVPAARPAASMHVPDEERMAAESNLRDMVRAVLGDQADRVELRAVLGVAGRKLVDTARKVNAQLIVLASRGTTSMLMGTVSQYVLRHAPCPVLVVPARVRADLRPEPESAG